MTLWKRIFQERRRVALPLAVLLIGNLAVLGLVVFPLQRSVSGAEEQLGESRRTLSTANLLLKNTQKEKSSKIQAEQELKKFYEDFLPPGPQEAQDLISFTLNRVAREAGVSNRRSQPDVESPKGSSLTRITNRVVLEGEYQNIKRFLFAMESAKPFIVIDKVELSQSGSNAANAGNVIEITLDVSTYYFSGRVGK